MFAHCPLCTASCRIVEEDMVGKMWQVHGKCEKDHTGKLFGKWALAAAYEQKQSKQSGHLPPSQLHFSSFGLDGVARWCPCPSRNGWHRNSPTSATASVSQPMHFTAWVITWIYICLFLNLLQETKSFAQLCGGKSALFREYRIFFSFTWRFP